jgi:hypothetical protein
MQEPVPTARDKDITRRLNQIFLDPEVAEDQSRGAAELDTVGTDWTDAGWWSVKATCAGWNSEDPRDRHPLKLWNDRMKTAL